MAPSAAALADSLRGAFAGEACIAAWLFGSQARGDGVLLIDNDRAARIAFEVRSRNLWFDLEPVRRRYRAGR